MIKYEQLQRVDKRDTARISQLVNERTPFILAGETDDWPAAKLWRMDYLCIDPYLRKLKKEIVQNNYYLKNWQFWVTRPELLQDYDIPKAFSIDYSPLVTGHMHALKWIFIGNKGTYSKSHYDLFFSSAWLYLACGVKEWRLMKNPSEIFSKDNTPDLFQLDHDEQAHNYTIWSAQQMPGEIVWVPPKVLHAVFNHEFAIALTHNYINSTNIIDALDYPDLTMQEKNAVKAIISKLNISHE